MTLHTLETPDLFLLHSVTHEVQVIDQCFLNV